MASTHSLASISADHARGWGASVLLFPVCVYFGINDGMQTVLEPVSLTLHRSGEMMFGLIGPAALRAGGLLMQVLIPMLFLQFFVRRGYRFGVQIFLFWVGQNFFHLGAYAEAAAENLYHLPGDGVQDWQFFFNVLHLAGNEPLMWFLLNGVGFCCFALLLVLPSLMAPCTFRDF